MRPEPNDLIKGVRDLLRQAVAPELRSEQATLSLRRIMVVLRDTDWNEAAFALMRENRTLHRLAAEAIAWDDGQANHRSDEGVEALRSLAGQPPISDSFAAARSLNLAYRDALARLMTARPDAADLRALIIARLAEID